jgi:outer membrane protein OmpA-like peptidoglycan-associated protein
MEGDMRWKLLAGAVLSLVVWTRVASALDGAPVVGAEVGAAIPTGHFQRSAGNGGAIGAYGGYRVTLLDNSFAITLLGEPMYAAFPTGACDGTNQRPCAPSEGGVTGVFSLSANARFSLVDGPVDAYFTAGGGYYNATSGSVSGSAGGFNLGVGVQYAFTDNLSAGVFGRRDQASIDAATDSNSHLQFFTVGLNFEYRFVPTPPVVAAAPAPPPPPPPPIKQKIVLRGVNFDFNKADIRADARPILDEAIATLKQNAGVNIDVDGYTDNIGSAGYNEKLSVRRAEAVERYLADGGINASRMTVHGFGATHFVASNDTADGRAQNRRVELNVVSGN